MLTTSLRKWAWTATYGATGKMLRITKERSICQQFNNFGCFNAMQFHFESLAGFWGFFEFLRATGEITFQHLLLRSFYKKKSWANFCLASGCVSCGHIFCNDILYVFSS